MELKELEYEEASNWEDDKMIFSTATLGNPYLRITVDLSGTDDETLSEIVAKIEEALSND